MNQMNCSKNSVYQGDGILSNSSGDRFEGQFKDGQRHGNGVLVTASGIRLEGEWKKISVGIWSPMIPMAASADVMKMGVWKSPENPFSPFLLPPGLKPDSASQILQSSPFHFNRNA